MQKLHPETFYQIALQLAGEMATFTDKVKRRPPTLPAYDHDDLQRTFEPLMRELRRSLSLEAVSYTHLFTFPLTFEFAFHLQFFLEFAFQFEFKFTIHNIAS